MSAARPIIVIRKKSAHAGHHGGAWKVAYADFVTAMMSLFIVLWLMNTSTPIKKIIAGYFRDPKSSAKLTGTDHDGMTDSLSWKKQDIQRIKAQIAQAMHAQDNLKALQNHVNMVVTPEGLRIELTESSSGTFFDSGSADLSKGGKEMLKLLAQQLGQVPNRISIEGYTDAKPYPSKTGYTNWDLSTDRANAARRLMQANGLHENQVAEVRGYGDQNLRLPDRPLDPSNRRVTIVVHYPTMTAVTRAGGGSVVTGGSVVAKANSAVKLSVKK